MTLEWRQKYALSGILLYVCSTVFIIYLSFLQIPARTWNAVFWIILLFAAVNAVTKSFIGENGNRQMYYYSLANPTALILAKIIYNSCLLFLIGSLTFILLSVMGGAPVKNLPLFGLVLLLGSIGFSAAFTFLAGISAQANNGATLLAVLGFPVILPILITDIRLSAIALELFKDTGYWKDLLVLLSIDVILITLSLILFPYLWRR